MRAVVLPLAALIAISLSTGVFAADPPGNPTDELVQLEQHYYGHTYDTDTREHRVERLEKMIFGEVLPGDTDARIQNMFAAIPHDDDPSSKAVPAASSAGQPDATTAADTPDTTYYDDEDDQDAGPAESYPRISSLENIILGQTYTSDSLSKRLGRLEVKAFGSESKNPDLSDRTEALERYAQKTYHKKPLGMENNQAIVDISPPPPNSPQSGQGGARPAATQGAQEYPAPSRSKQIGSMLGSAALGVASAALGMPGVLPGFAGVGMGGYPSGGMPQQQEQPDRPPDNPAVHLPDPPYNAAMLTKVGWCEVQLFGHTFSQMHLMERLRQISGTLNMDLHKTNMQLMDDVPDYMKAIVARNGKKQSIGSTP